MSAKSDPRPEVTDKVVAEYYRRRPLSAREMLTALSAGVAIGAVVFYVARVAMGRSRIVVGGESIARTSSRPLPQAQRRRARNG